MLDIFWQRAQVILVVIMSYLVLHRHTSSAWTFCSKDMQVLTKNEAPPMRGLNRCGREIVLVGVGGFEQAWKLLKQYVVIK